MLVVYCAHMSTEPEDLNEFDARDCGLAALMLGIVPAVLNFVFNGMKEALVSTALMGAVGVLVALVVFCIAYFTHSRVVGYLVNLAGCILTPIYIFVAICLWSQSGEKTEPAQEPAAENAPAEPGR